MLIKRGDIFNIYIPRDERDPHKQIGERPCVIISNDKNNMHCSRVQYIPLTSKDKKYIPTHVQLKNTLCLEKESIALCECLDGIDKSFIKDKIGRISVEDMINIENAIDIQFSINRASSKVKFVVNAANQYAYA